MITAALLASALAACSGGGTAPAPLDTGARAGSAADPRAPEARRERVLVVGTSLTAGLGLDDPGLAYPGLLQREVDAAGLPYAVVNAGVSGETSAGARSRMDWLLSRPVAVLVLETGANDGLRGIETGSLRENLQAIIDRAREQEPPPAIVLLGMRTLTNYGADYGERFAAVYREVAEANQIPLVPFLLEGVGGVPELNQADGIHPTPEGQRVLATTVWPVLEPVLRALSASATASGDAEAP
jgi:acyl-CoA thioesterase-1